MIRRNGKRASLLFLSISVSAPALAQVSPVGAWTAIDLDSEELVGTALLAADFDADGQSDLAYSAHNQTYGNVRFTLAIGGQIVPVGSASGSYYTNCGHALAAGHFAQTSARPRIAVGCPALSSGSASGAVRIYRIPPSNDQVTYVRELRPGVDGLVGSPGTADQFGFALAAGDFDADGADDLAIGSPGAVAGGIETAGAVFVVYGDASGLDPAHSQRWTQNSAGVPDSSELNDRFGKTLATGDFDGDGYEDLAIGAENEEVGGDDGAGAVTILFGSPLGLATSGPGAHAAQWLTQGDGIVPGEAETSDYFGESLASGKIVSDGGGGPLGDEDDLVIGAPGEDYDGEQSAGVAILLVGRSGGFTGAGSVLLSQAPLPGAVESGDEFGDSLAVADFSGDGWEDIAVGSLWEDVGAIHSLGIVHLVFGGAGGLDLAGAQLLVPDSEFPFAPLGNYDHFGAQLAGADLDGNGIADLAVGDPWWDYRFPDPDIVNAGHVMVLFDGP